MRDKFSDIVRVIFTVAVIVWLAKSFLTKDYSEQEAMEQEINDLTPMLAQTENIIATIMNDPEAYDDFVNREWWYVYTYISPTFNYDRLTNLKDQLVKNHGWIDITRPNKIVYQSNRSIGLSGTIPTETTRVLCKNKATLIIFMHNINKRRDDNNEKIGTEVDLTYNKDSPCYHIG